MKQKVTSIFLLATLVLSLLVGCSTDEGNSSNYPDESPSSVSSGIVESPQSTDSVEQSSAGADDSGVEAEDPSGSNGQSNMTGQEIDQPVSSTLPTEITAATSFSLSDVKPYSGSAYVGDEIPQSGKAATLDYFDYRPELNAIREKLEIKLLIANEDDPLYGFKTMYADLSLIHI